MEDLRVLPSTVPHGRADRARIDQARHDATPNHMIGFDEATVTTELAPVGPDRLAA